MVRSAGRADRYDLAALVVLIAASFLYAREIANDFLWGHDGGNGAPYWNAAENTIRFGVLGQAKDYTGLARPSAPDFYTHHPPLLHLNLVIVRALLGRAEWVGRLVPFLYSLGVLGLLYRIGRALYTPMFALASVVLFALTPLHLIFGTMIDHEQGGIFWTLLATYGAVRWLRFDRKNDRVVTIVATTAALQWAWGSYFVIAVVGALAILRSLRSLAGRPRDRARSLAITLFVIGIANLVFFFALVVVTKGTLSDMRSILSLRTSEIDGYADATFGRALDLYGPVVLGLVAAGVARFVGRLRDGRLRTRDVIPIAFALGQIGLSLAFKNAGRIHAYWTYYAGIACALFGADALVAIGSWVRARVGTRGLAVATVIALFMQTSTALARQDWGLATGHAAYASNFDDQFEEVQLAKWLNARYGRDVTYSIHPSLRARVEVFYYLDAPHLNLAEGRAFMEEHCPTRACVFVANLRAIGDPVALAQIEHARSMHASSLFAGRLLVVDLGTPPENTKAYRLEHQQETSFHRWFVNGRHPPSSWQIGEEPSESLPSALTDLARVTFVAESSKTGRAVGEACTRGQALVGVASRSIDGELVAMQGLCGDATKPERTGWIGEDARGEVRETLCPAGASVIGIAVPSANQLAPITLQCASSDAGALTGYKLACPTGTLAISLHARRAASITGVGIGCGTL